MGSRNRRATRAWQEGQDARGGEGGDVAEKAAEEFQGGKEENSSERPSTRRPSFKSKTNPGPADRDGPTNARITI